MQVAKGTLNQNLQECIFSSECFNKKMTKHTTLTRQDIVPKITSFNYSCANMAERNFGQAEGQQVTA